MMSRSTRVQTHTRKVTWDGAEESGRQKDKQLERHKTHEERHRRERIEGKTNEEEDN